MNKHPYLRAYLAGIAVPTVFLLFAMTAYAVIRYVWHVPIPIERLIVFPMAVVPNVWGLWNVIYASFDGRDHLPLGVFGGALPLLLAPCGYVVLRLFAIAIPHEVFSVAAFALPIGLVVYYLVWKHFVGFLNAELGVA